MIVTSEEERDQNGPRHGVVIHQENGSLLGLPFREKCFWSSVLILILVIFRPISTS